MQAATRNKSQSTSDLEDLLSFETDAHEGSPEEILLNTGDWHGLYQKLTDTSINPSQRREILLQAFAHPNLLAVVKNSKNAELTDSEKTLLLHIISYQDHQVLDRFYEIVDGYATATCELIIAHDANKDAREKFGIERLAKKRSVLNNPYLLEKLLQHPEARAIIAEADIQQEGFWDKFVSTIFPEPESEETYARNYNSRRKFTRTQTSPPPRATI